LWRRRHLSLVLACEFCEKWHWYWCQHWELQVWAKPRWPRWRDAQATMRICSGCARLRHVRTAAEFRHGPGNLLMAGAAPEHLEAKQELERGGRSGPAQPEMPHDACSGAGEEPAR
jgi:hypothetical protein